MFLIVGLGNPGSQYESTRHNVGFLFLNRIAQEAGVSIHLPRFQSLSARGRWHGHEIFFLKPQTFMNLSGGPVQEAAAFFKIPPQQIVAVFDDLDQAPGAVRMRTGGGHGGHNGVRDMLAKLPSDEFHRLKIGIGKPAHKSATHSWVLGKFTGEEMNALDQESFPTAETRLRELIKRYDSK